MQQVRRCSAVLLLALFGLVPTAVAQQATITGRVTDQRTGLPIAGATILIPTTNVGTRTDQAGRFQINSAAGEVTLRVVYIGYGAQTQKVTVGAGQTAAQDFALTPAALELQAIVITATGAQRKAELGVNIAQINAPAIVATAPVRTLTDLLSARVPGVLVLQSSGTTGSGTRIRIRGSNSVSLSNEPLIFIDNIRANTQAGSLTVGAGGQQPSRLNDINPQDIETYEVVKGPAATTLYGPDAANGVIRITTKRGRAGAARWQGHTEYGMLDQVAQWPNNYRGINLTAATPALRTNCQLRNVAAGTCTQDSISRYNTLSDPSSTPFDRGNRQEHGLSVSGGSDAAQYYVAGDYENELGPYRMPQGALDSLVRLRNGAALPSYEVNPNRLEKVTLRGNLHSQLSNKLDLTTSASYLTSNLHLPQNDNNVLGLLPSGYFGTVKPQLNSGGTASVFNGGWGFYRPDEIFALEVLQQVQRFTGSATSNLTVSKFINARGTAGIDATTRQDVSFQPTGEGPNFGNGLLGQRNSNIRKAFTYTVDGVASANFNLTSMIASKTSVGAQYYHDLLTGTNTFGERIVAGARSVNAAARTTADETTSESKTFGVYVEQQFGLNDRLFVTGALRGDDHSAFGKNFSLNILPKATFSWVLSDEPFFPKPAFLSSLRVRSAWGTAILSPGTTDATRYFNAVAVTADGNPTTSAVTFGSLGNPDLKPERTTEIEGGLDMSLFTGRVGLELTYYRKKSKDALISRVLAPSLGVSTTQFFNLGAIQNKGFEAGLNSEILNGKTLKWDVTASLSTNENKVLDLGKDDTGKPLPPIIQGDQRFVVGYPAGGYWAPKLKSFTDANGNGIIEYDVARGVVEIDVDTAFTYVGTPFPKVQFSVTNGITLMDRVRVSGLLDYRGGQKLYNLTEWFRCGTPQNCRGLHDKTTSLFEQARATAAVYHPLRPAEPFMEDASFLKLRELAFTVFVPDSWTRMLKVRNASFTMTGRNLKTWTDYTGVDPEINQNGQANYTTRDFLTQPPVRYWIARVNIGF